MTLSRRQVDQLELPTLPAGAHDELDARQLGRFEFMCQHYGYDTLEIEDGLQRFRAIRDEVLAEQGLSVAMLRQPLPTVPARVVDFRTVKRHWDTDRQVWDSPEYVYIGREIDYYNLPESPWANHFHLAKDNYENRMDACGRYRHYLLTERKSFVQAHLPALRGKVLVCWCKLGSNKVCHGDVLVDLLAEMR